VTFRTRIAMASAVAVAIAVILAAGASFIVARHALVSSTDDTLVQAARTTLSHPFIDTNDSGGTLAQVVSADGTIIAQSPAGRLPVDGLVRTVARGGHTQTFTSALIDGTEFRELIVPVQTGIQVGGEHLPAIGTTRAALQLFVPLSGVNHQLGELGLTLLLVALGGVIIAALLGFVVARTALRPLNSVTDAVEALAETTDMSLRLEEGRADELGRLRSAFNHLFTALERSDDQQRQLVLDASHELRTPLTSLRTNTEIMRQIDAIDPETREQIIADMLTQISELTTLIRDLTELARGESQVPRHRVPTRRTRRRPHRHRCHPWPHPIDRDHQRAESLHSPFAPGSPGSSYRQPARQRHQVESGGRDGACVSRRWRDHCG